MQSIYFSEIFRTSERKEECKLLYDVIKEIAKKKGIPIRKIEDECGFAQGSMCKWNDVSPSWDKVQKVANYLCTDIGEFILQKGED